MYKKTKNGDPFNGFTIDIVVKNGIYYVLDYEKRSGVIDSDEDIIHADIVDYVKICGHSWKTSVIFAHAFDHVYSKIETVSLPNTISEIQSIAFAGFEKFKNAILPASVKKICKYAYADIDSLENIVFLGTKPPKLYKESFSTRGCCGCCYKPRTLWLPNIKDEKTAELFVKEKWNVVDVRFGAYPEGMEHESIL